MFIFQKDKFLAYLLIPKVSTRFNIIVSEKNIGTHLAFLRELTRELALIKQVKRQYGPPKS